MNASPDVTTTEQPIIIRLDSKYLPTGQIGTDAQITKKNNLPVVKQIDTALNMKNPSVSQAKIKPSLLTSTGKKPTLATEIEKTTPKSSVGTKLTLKNAKTPKTLLSTSVATKKTFNDVKNPLLPQVSTKTSLSTGKNTKDTLLAENGTKKTLTTAGGKTTKNNLSNSIKAKPNLSTANVKIPLTATTLLNTKPTLLTANTKTSYP
jgi:hypothetical protein